MAKPHVLWPHVFGREVNLFYSWDRAAPRPLNGFSRSTRHTTCFRARMCLWGSRCYLCPFKGSKAPKAPILGAWIGVFKPNAHRAEQSWNTSIQVNKNSPNQKTHNIGMVYKVQETRNGCVCKDDAAAWLVMVVSTRALLGRVWFIVAKLMMLCPSLSPRAHTCTLGQYEL